MLNKNIRISNFLVGNKEKIIFIAGPSQIQSRQHALEIAAALTKLSSKFNFKLIFNASFDKANRTSLQSKRGLGLLKSIKIFEEIKETYGCPIMTDIYTEEQCLVISNVADIIQIPSNLAKQTDLLIASASTGKIINVRKGTNMTANEMYHVINKIENSGNDNIFLTERGTSFGYNNVILDINNIEIMKRLNYPVIVDITSCCQLPGAGGNYTKGKKDFINSTSHAVTALGIAGISVKVDDNPDELVSNFESTISLFEFSNLATEVINIDNIIKNNNE